MIATAPITRSILLKLDTAAVHRRRSQRSLKLMVEGGNVDHSRDLFEQALIWVFNVATDANGQKRDLRFWSVEIDTPARAVGADIDDVIVSLLGERRENFAPGDLIEIFCWQHENIFKLKKLGVFPPSQFTPRAVLENFLRTRHISHCPPVLRTAINGGAR